MRGIINWLFYRQTKMITVEIPTALEHALETYTYMQNRSRAEDNQVTRDDVVTLALAEHMQTNLWANVVDDFEVVTKLHSREVPYKDQSNVRPLPPTRSRS